VRQGSRGLRRSERIGFVRGRRRPRPGRAGLLLDCLLLARVALRDKALHDILPARVALRDKALPVIIAMALASAAKSALMAVKPPPAVAASGVRPLSKPGGAAAVAAALLNISASSDCSAEALSAPLMMVAAVSPDAVCISRVNAAAIAIFRAGPTETMEVIRLTIGIGAPSATNGTTGRPVPPM
jgi:hypothetical protein